MNKAIFLFFVTIPVFLQIPSCSRGSDKFSFCENLDLRTHYIERYGAGKKSFHHYLYASNYKEECFDQYEFVKHLITYSDTVKQAQPVSGITVCIDNINFKLSSHQQWKRRVKSYRIALSFDTELLHLGTKEIRYITFWQKGKSYTVNLDP